MTIELPVDDLVVLATVHPWPVVVVVFLVLVVAPAVWSRHAWRRRAALAVLRTLGRACDAVASILRRAPSTLRLSSKANNTGWKRMENTRRSALIESGK